MLWVPRASSYTNVISPGVDDDPSRDTAIDIELDLQPKLTGMVRFQRALQKWQNDASQNHLENSVGVTAQLLMKISL